MNTVHVCASKSYDIRIGAGILDDLGDQVHALGNCCKVCVVSDSNVWPLYGGKVRSSLENAGFGVCHFVFPAGEQSKTASVYLQLLNFMAKEQINRTDILVAVGGGVVGDLAGFAAATYLRGIRFVQVPTTLLAAVDSSVGGKTAIDLDAGKNLAGAFCQPSLVLCDIDTLHSLPGDIFADGCAEVIKYAVLYDPQLFAILEQSGPDFDRECIITRCVDWKRKAVMADEFDTGERMKLNLGHTVGHGIEAASHFAISHGKAVAMGIAIISKAFACQDEARIRRVLDVFSLPVRCDFTADELYHHMISDKKRAGTTIRLIVPHSIGDCRITAVDISELKSILQAGL